jgi:hypothetical protein
MKKNEDYQKYVQNVAKKNPLLKSSENGYSAKFGKSLKKFLYVSSLVGIGLFTNSCIAGYVDTEPTYVETVRPERPSNVHVWIDGDWIYSRQTHAYARQQGHWDKPVQGKVYVSGSWQVSSRGRYWTPGHWQRQK